MTNERAIEILDPTHREHYDSLETVNEACRMGMKALEKQIPKRVRVYKEPVPIKAVDTENGAMYTYLCYPCPNCKKWIVDNINHHFCAYCGQALNWNNEKD